jgi:hypothetical protein
VAVEVKWDDIDPNTANRRYFSAVRFGGAWTFRVRYQRRNTEWQRWRNPTLEMWETLLASLEKRARRRRDVGPEEVEEVKRLIAAERQRRKQFLQEEE